LKQAPAQTPGDIAASLVALLLAGSSLVVYLTGAVIGKIKMGAEGKTARSFSLGIPEGNKLEELFAISIVSAETTLSTVFVIFLTGGGGSGLHLLFCPMTFALGLLLMLAVYKRVEHRGYLDQSSGSGLIPHFAYRLTGNKLFGYTMVVACVLPLLAILSLLGADSYFVVASRSVPTRLDPRRVPIASELSKVMAGF